MARTAQEVYSLFGLKSPAQVRAERDEQFAQMLKGQSGAGRAGAGVGAMLGGLFRGEDPEAQRYRDFQDITKGQNLNDPNQLRAMAAGLENVSGFGEQALSMRMLADTIEKEQMGEVINAPAQVGVKPIYKQEFNDVGMPTGKYIQVGEEPLIKDVPHRRTAEGLVPLLDYGKFSTPEVEVTSDAPTSTDTVIDLEDGASLVRPGAIAEARTGEQEPAAVTTTQPTPTQGKGRAITEEELQRLEANTSGPGVAPREMETTEAVPSIARALPKGTPIYGDPKELSKARKAITQQIVALEKSNDKNKNAKLKILRERRKEIDKLRIASRRKGPPKDLQITGKDSDVLSGFGNVK